MAAKRVGLQTLYAQPSTNHTKIKALSDEMVNLIAQLAKKRNEYRTKCHNSYGRGAWAAAITVA